MGYPKEIYEEPEERPGSAAVAWTVKLIALALVVFAFFFVGRQVLSGASATRVKRSETRLPLMDLQATEKAVAAMKPEIREQAVGIARAVLEARGEHPAGLLSIRWIRIGQGPYGSSGDFWHIHATFRAEDGQATCAVNRDISIEGDAVSDAESRRNDLMSHKVSPLPNTPEGVQETES